MFSTRSTGRSRRATSIRPAGRCHPEGAAPRLLFQRNPKTPTTSIPIHLDLKAEDPEAEVERLVGLGATIVETKSRSIGPFTENWTVMQDPERNGFCVS
jgi:hypothetical protein